MEAIDWYYSHRGNKLGPISADQLMSLRREGKIEDDAHVWRNGLKDWIPFGDSELAIDRSKQVPPPLKSHLVSNTWVWLMAFLPLVFSVLDVGISEIRFEAALQNSGFMYLPGVSRHNFTGIHWSIVVGTFLTFILLDERNLRKAGYGKRYYVALAVLLLPVYLFVRAKRLRQAPSYAIVFLVCLVAGILLEAAT